MEEKKISFMKLALDLARENLEKRNGGPFGCVIVKDGEVIATGYNKVIIDNDPTSHAEIVAIRKACRKLNTHFLSGCEVYSSCEPCPMCMSAIYWARPDKLYYSASRTDAADAGFNDKHIYDELSLMPDKREISGERLLKEEGEDIFHLWKDMDIDIKY